MSDYIHKSHNVTVLLYHLVFPAKYRRALFEEQVDGVPARTKAKLREAANEHMAMLAQSLERVMSYFQDRRVRYAA